MPRVTLTFDNGPEPGVTEGVLDALAAAGVSATFFVIGEKIATPAGRRLAVRAREAGHKIGNHTFTHSIPLGLADSATLDAEIGATQRLLGDLAPERLFRPHGGGRIGPHLLSKSASDYLVAGGFTCVTWNVVPRDWKDPDGWADRALAGIACERQPWSVVVLHDLPTGAMRLLPGFLDKLCNSGAEMTQDFPQECLPIVKGRPMPPLKDLVTSAQRIPK